MIGRTAALAGALLFSTQVYAQTNQNSAGPAQGTVSGPAAGSLTSMRSPQAGALETQHQRKVIGQQSRSVRNKAHQVTRNTNDETGATGSSSPRDAAPPK
jgi:hypothetical protein